MSATAETIRLPVHSFANDFDELDELLFGEAEDGEALTVQDIADTDVAEDQLQRLEYYERQADRIREHAKQQREKIKEKLAAVGLWEESQLRSPLERITFYEDNLTRFLQRVFRESGEKTKSVKLVNGTIESRSVGGGCEEVSFDEFEKWAVKNGLAKELITVEVTKSIDKAAIKRWSKENDGEIPDGIDISTGDRKFTVKTAYAKSKKEGQ